ncbi:MAG: C40 family peptidase, partial [Lachnospiraceae bacterium]|nr:C40 family peptidase [Lachnospiraceae bacterium]
EEDKSELETSHLELQEGQAYMEEMLAQKREEYENYSVMLTKAKQEAANYTAKIKQETAQIKKLEEEERKRREEEERKRKEEEEKRRKEQEALASQDGNEDSGGSSKKEEAPKPTVSGSGKGADIANYACKFVGNPYVAGGTSLTNGADCSGFVMAVYKNFGISLPRSSYSQSTVGRGVSYSEAQPGDVIYYGGHVGIYIGNGQIVHASTERTGIKITSATYRSIISVRRIV